ncbi:penicillin-insensitive murein endopeptidase [Mesocricetibacter intestinalis]|nr:penicillin-insensitive murein endopeptidase [Mesocricetibacter intestinalis]
MPIFSCFGIILSLFIFSGTIQAAPQDWQRVKRPIPGTAEPIGNYTNGCIIGAQALPLRGEGYQVIRAGKNRYYGHPEMIAYLQRLGRKVRSAGLPDMLVGDIAMPGGGRFLTGHASHQMGLDADIWLKMGSLSDREALNPTAILMVNRSLRVVDEKAWSRNQTELIRLAAEDQQVTRIFVNPAIKVKLCKTAGNDRRWLQKIRPWFGHDAHFHVRLACPKGAAYCEEQAPVPAGDGCGEELSSWFKPAKPSAGVTAKRIPPEPFLCQQVMSSPDRSEWLE